MVDTQLDACMKELESNSARFTCVKCGSDNTVQVIDLKKYIGDDLFAEIDALERELMDEARLLRQLEAQLSQSPVTSRSETVGYELIEQAFYSPEPHLTLKSPPKRVVTRSRSRTCPPRLARTRIKGRAWDIMNELV